jgi:hypothetical protein
VSLEIEVAPKTGWDSDHLIEIHGTIGVEKSGKRGKKEDEAYLDGVTVGDWEEGSKVIGLNGCSIGEFLVHIFTLFAIKAGNRSVLLDNAAGPRGAHIYKNVGFIKSKGDRAAYGDDNEMIFPLTGKSKNKDSGQLWRERYNKFRKKLGTKIKAKASCKKFWKRTPSPLEAHSHTVARGSTKKRGGNRFKTLSDTVGTRKTNKKRTRKRAMRGMMQRGRVDSNYIKKYMDDLVGKRVLMKKAEKGAPIPTSWETVVIQPNYDSDKFIEYKTTANPTAFYYAYPSDDTQPFAIADIDEEQVLLMPAFTDVAKDAASFATKHMNRPVGLAGLARRNISTLDRTLLKGQNILEPNQLSKSEGSSRIIRRLPKPLGDDWKTVGKKRYGGRTRKRGGVKEKKKKTVSVKCKSKEGAYKTCTAAANKDADIKSAQDGNDLPTLGKGAMGTPSPKGGSRTRKKRK